MGWGWVLVFFLFLELLFRKVFRAMSQWCVFKILFLFKIFVFTLLYIYFLHGSAYVLALFWILIPSFLG